MDEWSCWWSLEPRARRRPESDRFFDEGNALVEQLSKWEAVADDDNDEDMGGRGGAVCAEPGCGAAFGTEMEMADHYQLEHAHDCATCGAGFTNDRELSLHVRESHDSYFALLAERQPPQFECVVSSCQVLSATAAARELHLAVAHSFPDGFRLRPRRQGRSTSKSASSGRSDGS